MPKTIVLIHGAWVAPNCWDSFRGHFEALGYPVLAPAWPMLERPIGQLRRTPHRELGELSIARIVDHYEKLIRELSEAPILMGHSFGGLFVQMLLNRGVGAAGVAICPAPARGVLPTLGAISEALPVFLAWRGWNRGLTITFEQFARGFVHTLPPDEQRALFDAYVVPTPGRLYYQTLLGLGNKVDFQQPDRAPLLLIAADQDRMVPLSMVQATYEKYRAKGTATGFTSFTDRTHFLISMPGWEEIADHAIRWAAEHAPPGVTTASRALPESEKRDGPTTANLTTPPTVAA